MLKNLFPLGVSALLFLLFQFLNLGLQDVQNIKFLKTDEVRDIVEIKRYMDNFNPNLGKLLTEEKVRIDTTLNGANKITIVNVMQYDKWIGKNSNLNVMNKDIFLDSSILTLRKPYSSGSKSGYIRLISLRSGAYQSFMKGMESLAGTAGIDTLFLDLRGCNNGQDMEAVKIVNQLVYNADIILGKEMFFNGTVNKINSRGKVFFPLKQINLITNSSTAGVSEFMIRMLIAGGNVSISGNSTPGHNLIMRFFPLSSGNYAMMPIGYYCNTCDKVDKNYNADKMMPIMPDVPMEDSEVESMIGKKFKVNL